MDVRFIASEHLAIIGRCPVCGAKTWTNLIGFDDFVFQIAEDEPDFVYEFLLRDHREGTALRGDECQVCKTVFC